MPNGNGSGGDLLQLHVGDINEGLRPEALGLEITGIVESPFWRPGSFSLYGKLRIFSLPGHRENRQCLYAAANAEATGVETGNADLRHKRRNAAVCHIHHEGVEADHLAVSLRSAHHHGVVFHIISRRSTFGILPVESRHKCSANECEQACKAG